MLTLPIRVSHGNESTREQKWPRSGTVHFYFSPLGARCAITRIEREKLRLVTVKRSAKKVDAGTANKFSEAKREQENGDRTRRDKEAEASWKLETCQWRYRAEGGTSCRGVRVAVQGVTSSLAVEILTVKMASSRVKICRMEFPLRNRRRVLLENLSFHGAEWKGEFAASFCPLWHYQRVRSPQWRDRLNAWKMRENWTR